MRLVEAPGGGLPPWGKFVALLGLPGSLLMFLLGAIPGLQSPYARQSELVLEQQRTIQIRDRALRVLNYQILRTVQQTCRGMWQHAPDEQALCTHEWTVPDLSLPRGREQ